jgi:transcriptional regulator with XRE-family HTH domain
MTQFGNYIKKLRIQQSKSLRDFCHEHGFDPGNYSRIERGRFPAPNKTELLEKYALALGLSRGSEDWIEFFDVAAASRGVIPPDLLEDDALLQKLPMLFRTLRATPVEDAKLDKLVEEIRKG